MDASRLTAAEVAKMIDHTNLKANAAKKDIEKLCAEAVTYGFGAVCVNPVQVKLASSLLEGSGVKVCTVIGFPLGQSTLKTKLFELGDAIENGAEEADWVVNVSAVRSSDFDYVREEMSALAGLCRERGVTSKVIFENCYLAREDIALLAAIAADVRPDFIKTSTGFGTGGATVEDVALMKSVVGDRVRIKAAGGIRDWAAAKAMLEAGAERIGASAGVKILSEIG